MSSIKSRRILLQPLLDLLMQGRPQLQISLCGSGMLKRYSLEDTTLKEDKRLAMSQPFSIPTNTSSLSPRVFQKIAMGIRIFEHVADVGFILIVQNEGYRLRLIGDTWN